jgi:hypothetical protein
VGAISVGDGALVTSSFFGFFRISKDQNTNPSIPAKNITATIIVIILLRLLVFGAGLVFKVDAVLLLTAVSRETANFNNVAFADVRWVDKSVTEASIVWSPGSKSIIVKVQKPSSLARANSLRAIEWIVRFTVPLGIVFPEIVKGWDWLTFIGFDISTLSPFMAAVSSFSASGGLLVLVGEDGGAPEGAGVAAAGGVAVGGGGGVGGGVVCC